MGTKNNPGKYDCYDKADPDEPLFVLRAKDPTAPDLVRLWVDTRRNEARIQGLKIDPEYEDKLEEALSCARAMEVWRLQNVSVAPEQSDAI